MDDLLSRLHRRLTCAQVGELAHGLHQDIYGKLSRVCRGFGKTAKRLHQVLDSQCPDLRRTLSHRQFGNGRPTSHRRHASPGAKSSLGDPRPRDAQRQPQDIPAGWILELDSDIRVIDFPRVARVFEVIQQLWRVHFLIVVPPVSAPAVSR